MHRNRYFSGYGVNHALVVEYGMATNREITWGVMLRLGLTPLAKETASGVRAIL